MHTSFRVGDLLDSKYRIKRLLGWGGFGEVYLAEDELVGRQVAIKLLRDQDPDRQAGLVAEMRSLDQLRHPAVVTFYTHFTSDRLLFLVMEYCAGGSLRSRMRPVPAPLHITMQLGRDLAETLELYTGEASFITILNRTTFYSLLRMYSRLATLAWQIVTSARSTTWRPRCGLGGVDALDVRVDVYALGITLRELLQNRNPFEKCREVRSSARRFVTNSFRQNWSDGCGGDFKGYSPTPELRFQTMREFQEAIDSKHVAYVFDRSRVQAHALAAKAETLLARKHAAAAKKCIAQALYVCPDCVSALIAAGRYNLFTNRISEAKQCFDQALALNPRANIQKELGWLNLEAGNHSQAISLLTDHLQRNAADYEAFNLLIECLYQDRALRSGHASLQVNDR